MRLQLARLRELGDLEQDGCAVEVTSRWGTQALQLCREALITLATRLELQVRACADRLPNMALAGLAIWQVRASLAEREASTRAVRKAEATLAELAAASHEASSVSSSEEGLGLAADASRRTLGSAAADGPAKQGLLYHAPPRCHSPRRRWGHPSAKPPSTLI